MPDSPTPAQSATPDKGVLENCVMGLKVLGGELKWLITGWLRGYETKQVQKRLDAEYITLGKLAREHLESGGKAPMSSDGEAGVVLSQISFLEKEVDGLAEDLERSRSESIKTRKRELGLEDE